MTDSFSADDALDLRQRLEHEWQMLCNRMAVASMAFQIPGYLGAVPDLFGPVKDNIETLLLVAEQIPDARLPIVKPDGIYVDRAAAAVSGAVSIPDDLSELDTEGDPKCCCDAMGDPPCPLHDENQEG